jgi:hypothetical protein
VQRIYQYISHENGAPIILHAQQKKSLAKPSMSKSMTLMNIQRRPAAVFSRAIKQSSEIPINFTAFFDIFHHSL